MFKRENWFFVPLCEESGGFTVWDQVFPETKLSNRTDIHPRAGGATNGQA